MEDYTKLPIGEKEIREFNITKSYFNNHIGNIKAGKGKYRITRIEDQTIQVDIIEFNYEDLCQVKQCFKYSPNPKKHIYDTPCVHVPYVTFELPNYNNNIKIDISLHLNGGCMRFDSEFTTPNLSNLFVGMYYVKGSYHLMSAISYTFNIDNLLN